MPNDERRNIDEIQPECDAKDTQIKLSTTVLPKSTPTEHSKSHGRLTIERCVLIDRGVTV